MVEQARIRAWFVANPCPVQPLRPGTAKRHSPAWLIAQLMPRPGHEIPVVGASIPLAHAATGLGPDILSDAIHGR
ncbi:hypothetical protein [Elioraea sp.]|uniref:hypothetical protein n=1 Tax=Elioraea sp. TaxID=2185103 RepID=UPI003F70AB1E